MLALIWFVALISPILCHKDGLEVNIAQGKLIGKSGKDRKGNPYYSFLSIPYARPPIGSLRFLPPVQPKSWKGFRDATKTHPVCPQWLLGENIGDEDCLYLNVHTPGKLQCEANKLKPVIVFIHGGSLLEGTGQNYGPEFLIPECVVLVTINYRLGLFGFLNSDNEQLGIPGNNGFKDQVMALKWVQRNINRFGGDPGNVMIAGESAGGVSVHLHMLSKMSKGLFHRAVAMSGLAELPWASGMANNLKLLNVDWTKNSASVWSKLKRFSKDDVMAAQRNVPLIMPINMKFETGPVIEPDCPGAFLTDRPLHIINSGRYNKVPFMIGYTDLDGLIGDVMTRRDHNRNMLITKYEEMVPQNINKTGLDLHAVGKEVFDFYFKGETPTLMNYEKSVDMITGGWFLSAIPFVVNAHVRTQKEPVYLYRWSADTDMNYVKRIYPDLAKYKGATHIEDLAYLFNNEHTPTIKPGSNEDIAIETAVKLFANFAKTGNPSDEWKPVATGKPYFMDIGIHGVPGITPDGDAYEFWERFYDKYL